MPFLSDQSTHGSCCGAVFAILFLSACSPAPSSKSSKLCHLRAILSASDAVRELARNGSAKQRAWASSAFDFIASTSPNRARDMDRVLETEQRQVMRRKAALHIVRSSALRLVGLSAFDRGLRSYRTVRCIGFWLPAMPQHMARRERWTSLGHHVPSFSNCDLCFGCHLVFRKKHS
jgi:hypothetical protein